MRLIDIDALGIGYAKPDIFVEPQRGYGWNDAIEIIFKAPIVNGSAIKWTKIKTRPLTAKEKALYNDDIAFMFDCDMPDDGQEILVATKWGVDKDICSIYDGIWLEGRGDWDDVLAWAPMPVYQEDEVDD